MSLRLQIIMLIVEVLYFVLIFSLLKKKTLMLSYTLTWLFAGIVMTVFTIFPELMQGIFDLLHIESPMNGLLSLCVFCLLIIMVFLTTIVSKQTNQIRKLTQDNALLEKRIRDIEKKDSTENQDMK